MNDSPAAAPVASIPVIQIQIDQPYRTLTDEQPAPVASIPAIQIQIGQPYGTLTDAQKDLVDHAVESPLGTAALEYVPGPYTELIGLINFERREADKKRAAREQTDNRDRGDEHAPPTGDVATATPAPAAPKLVKALDAVIADDELPGTVKPLRLVDAITGDFDHTYENLIDAAELVIDEADLMVSLVSSVKMLVLAARYQGMALHLSRAE